MFQEISWGSIDPFTVLSDYGMYLIIAFTVVAILLAKLSQYLGRRSERRIRKRYQELFDKPMTEQVKGKGKVTVEFEQFYESVKGMTSQISEELTEAGFPEPEAVTLQQMLASLSPATRRKLEGSFGPLFAGETGEMFTQVLELFKSIMLTNYRLAMYRQKKIAAHAAIGLEAEMLGRDLKLALEGVKEAGRVRAEFERLSGLDKPERMLGMLITRAKYHNYVEALMEANGITDQAVIEAAKSITPLLPDEVDDDIENAPEVIIVNQEPEDSHFNSNGKRFVYRTGISNVYSNGSAKRAAYEVANSN